MLKAEPSGQPPNLQGDSTKMFLFFSDILGRPVISAGGKRLGKLFDVKVKLGERFPKLAAVVVRLRKRKLLMLDWSEIDRLNGKRIFLREGADGRLSPLNVYGDEMLLKEELLDKQVVDTHGAKIERVNDIHFLVINKDLRIIHVDIGKRGILRRLGLLRNLDILTNWFFEYQIPEVLVSWKYIQPLASDPNKKDLKLNVAARGLHDLHPSELADILEDLDRENQKRIFKSLDLETAADTLQEVDPKMQLSLLESASEEKASDILEEMEPDEATDLLSEMPKEKRRKLIQTMEKPQREKLEELLTFKEGTAGSIMTKDYLAVRDDQCIGDAVSEFKNTSHPLESAAYIYVTDPANHLLGVITLRHLILMEKNTPVKEMMNTQLIKVEAEDDVEKVADVFNKYKFLMIPVVGEDNALKGVITYQDIIEERCRL